MNAFKPSESWYNKYSQLDEDILAGSFDILRDIRIGSEVVLSNQEKTQKMKLGFGIVMHKLRISQNLKLESLAQKADVEVIELVNIENEPEYKPSLRTIYQLAKFYDLPYKTLALIAGAINYNNEVIADDMIRYAAHSRPFEKLTKEEKKQLNEIVKIIREFDNIK